MLAICFFVSEALAVGTCIYHGGYRVGTRIRHYWTVTTDASGDMTEDVCAGKTMKGITGWLIQVEFWPDGSNPWDDNTTDIQLRGQNTNPSYNSNYDYAHGTGANLDNSITDSDNIRAPLTSDGTYIWLHGVKMVPWVDEAGNANTGIVFAVVQP